MSQMMDIISYSVLLRIASLLFVVFICISFVSAAKVEGNGKQIAK